MQQVVFLYGHEAVEAQAVFRKVLDATPFFIAEFAEHHLFGLLSLLQPPVCAHVGMGLPS